MPSFSKSIPVVLLVGVSVLAGPISRGEQNGINGFSASGIPRARSHLALPPGCNQTLASLCGPQPPSPVSVRSDPSTNLELSGDVAPLGGDNNNNRNGAKIDLSLTGASSDQNGRFPSRFADLNRVSGDDTDPSADIGLSSDVDQSSLLGAIDLSLTGASSDQNGRLPLNPSRFADLNRVSGDDNGFSLAVSPPRESSPFSASGGDANSSLDGHRENGQPFSSSGPSDDEVDASLRDGESSGDDDNSRSSATPKQQAPGPSDDSRPGPSDPSLSGSRQGSQQSGPSNSNQNGVEGSENGQIFPSNSGASDDEVDASLRGSSGPSDVPSDHFVDASLSGSRQGSEQSGPSNSNQNGVEGSENSQIFPSSSGASDEVDASLRGSSGPSDVPSDSFVDASLSGSRQGSEQSGPSNSNHNGVEISNQDEISSQEPGIDVTVNDRNQNGQQNVDVNQNGKVVL